MAKIALLGEKEWSTASAHFFLKKYLTPLHEVEIFDWTIPNETRRAIGGEFDLVIGEVAITRVKELGFDISPLTKFIPIFHNGTLKLDNPYFNIDYNLEELKTHYLGATTKHIQQEVKEKYNIEVDLFPLGICDNHWEKRNITSINKLGHVSKPHHKNWEGYEKVKRFNMFETIAHVANLPGGHVYGKHFSEGTKIYEGFDMIICTSTAEGQPFPFLECAAAKIPYISTNVGIIPEYKSVKTFKTIKEAVDIINHLNSSPLILQEYIDEVYNEVIADRNWKKIVNQYWIPQIEKILN